MAARAAGPGAADRADGQAEGVVGERQRVVPVATAPGSCAAPCGQPYSWDPGQPAGQELLGDDCGVRPGAFEFEQPGEVFGGVAGVHADEVALAFQRFGRFVVQPDGRGEPACGLGGEGQYVARGVSEPGGDLAAAGVEAGVTEDVGAGQRAVGIREAVEEAAVRGGAARQRLDVSQVRVGEPETDRAGRTRPVGGFEDKKSPAGLPRGLPRHPGVHGGRSPGCWSRPAVR